MRVCSWGDVNVVSENVAGASSSGYCRYNPELEAPATIWHLPPPCGGVDSAFDIIVQAYLAYWLCGVFLKLISNALAEGGL